MIEFFRKTPRRRLLVTLFWTAGAVFALTLLGFALR